MVPFSNFHMFMIQHFWIDVSHQNSHHQLVLTSSSARPNACILVQQNALSVFFTHFLTAYLTSASISKWCPRRLSFSGSNRWKSDRERSEVWNQTNRSGLYDGCFMIIQPRFLGKSHEPCAVGRCRDEGWWWRRAGQTINSELYVHSGATEA